MSYDYDEYDDVLMPESEDEPDIEVQDFEDEDDVHFAALQDLERLGGAIMDRVDEYYAVTQDCGLASMWQRMYRAYYGYTPTGSHNAASEIGYGGTQGELVDLKDNQLRSLCQHVHVATTQERPGFDPVARSSSLADLEAVPRAKDFLEDCMIDHDLESCWAESVEDMMVFGEGFIYHPWDESLGELRDDMATGDFDFQSLAPMDVARDWRKPWKRTEWVVVREFVNKYDLAATYPEFTEQILESQAGEKLPWWTLVMRGTDKVDSDDIPLYHFYHKPTAAVPEGRYVCLLDQETVFKALPMPYRRIPLVRMAPAEFKGSCYGFSYLWGLLSLQRVLDMMVSAGATNYDAHGVQVVAAMKGSEFSKDDLGQGMALLWYPPGGSPPQGINLTRMPEGYMDYTKFIIGQMETVSGVNASIRGNPSEALGKGAPAQALALLANQFVQFNSGMVRSATKGLEALGTNLVEIFRDMSYDTPRDLQFGDKQAPRRFRTMTGKDLDPIGKVRVELSNAMTRTLSGRMALVQMIMEWARHSKSQVWDGPETILEVIQTGRWQSGFESKLSEVSLIRMENEKLRQGEPVRVLIDDDHDMHITEHKVLTNDLELRANPESPEFRAVSQHLLEHFKLKQQKEGPTAPPPPAPSQGPGPGGGQGKPNELMDKEPEGTVPGVSLPKDPSTNDTVKLA